jgi:hypothetical protein
MQFLALPPSGQHSHVRPPVQVPEVPPSHLGPVSFGAVSIAPVSPPDVSATCVSTVVVSVPASVVGVSSIDESSGDVDFGVPALHAHAAKKVRIAVRQIMENLPRRKLAAPTPRKRPAFRCRTRSRGTPSSSTI